MAHLPTCRDIRPRDIIYSISTIEKLGINRRGVWYMASLEVPCDCLRSQFDADVRPKLDHDLRRLIGRVQGVSNVPDACAEFKLIGHKKGGHVEATPTILITCYTKECQHAIKKHFQSSDQPTYLTSFGKPLFVRLRSQQLQWAATPAGDDHQELETGGRGRALVGPATVLVRFESFQVGESTCGSLMNFQSVVEDETKLRYSRLGGVIDIDGGLYALTTAHAFAAPAAWTDNMLSSDQELSSSCDNDTPYTNLENDTDTLQESSSGVSSTDEDGSPNVFDVSSWSMISDDGTWLFGRGLHGEVQDGASNTDESDMDWAVFRIPNDSSASNTYRAPGKPLELISVLSVAEGGANDFYGPAYVLGARARAFPGHLNNSTISMHSSGCIFHLYQIRMEAGLESGLSGSWVVRGSCLLGIVVAADPKARSLYMISAQLTFESIKNAFGAQSIKPSQILASQKAQVTPFIVATNIGASGSIADPPIGLDLLRHKAKLIVPQVQSSGKNLSVTSPRATGLTISRIGNKKKDLGDTPARWQIIYRVHRQRQWSNAAATKTMEGWDHWLDKPRWCQESRQFSDDKSAMDIQAAAPMSLRGSIPISDINFYLHQHRELLFLVIREYEPKDHQATSRERFLPSGDDVAHLERESLPPSNEVISIVSTDLYKTCDKMFTSLPCRPNGFRPKQNYQLHAPYLSIFHSRSSLQACISRLNLREQENWNLLVNYVLESFGSEYEQVDTLISRGRISKPFLPYLFKPRQYLVRNENGFLRGYFSESWLKVSQRSPVTDEDYTFGDSSSVGSGDLSTGDGDSSPEDEPSFRGDEEPCPPYFLAENEDESNITYEVTAWAVKAYCWDFDGTFFVRSEDFQIPWTWRREEVIPISNLSLYPLDLAEDSPRSLLERRGRLFWDCRKKRLVSYRGPGSYESEERYIIDTTTYNEIHASRPETRDDRKELDASAVDSYNPPQDPFLLLLPTEIKGFNLLTKKWVNLAVERIGAVSWNKKAFDRLVLDEGMKQVLVAMVTKHSAAEKENDLVTGKGNGLTMLLHGPPGTGKTFTAESLAEYAEMPIYQVTCGDIGTDPDQVEKHFESVFRMSNMWNCIVLLDEADVFLEERSLNDLQRNALVSVFLRILEYFHGVLIMTSNRVGVFDEALKSRIQLAIHYQSLDRNARFRIWSNFIGLLRSQDAVGMVDFDDLEDFQDRLAEFNLNGRQIRNCITTARQLASYRGERLNFAMLRNVIEVSSKFDEYLQLTQGFTDAEYARNLQRR